MTSSLEGVENLKIPLEEIELATNNFSKENAIQGTDYGYEYKGRLSQGRGQRTVVVKRLERRYGFKEHEFLTEIMMLYSYKHKNLVSLVGFCNEDAEKIIVYEYQANGSLDKYLSSPDLTWMQRLRICVGAAHGLRHLHSEDGKSRGINRHIRSKNILLDDKFEAKISGLELSIVNAANQQFNSLLSNVSGTFGYVDPEYMKTGTVNNKSDVYSFGVVLFEVLCGRRALIPDYEEKRRFLAPLARKAYKEGKLDEIIYSDLKEQMDQNSFKAFSKVAYHCLNEERGQRLNMDQVVKGLENALQLQ